MFSDLLKSLELVTQAIGALRGPDAKRRRLAKDLFRVYLEVRTVVERGRSILALRGLQETSEVVGLLLDQQRSLETLSSAFSNSAIVDTLQLHSPMLVGSLYTYMEMKGRRIWFTIDQLTQGQEERAEHIEATKNELQKEVGGEAWIREYGIHQVDPHNSWRPQIEISGTDADLKKGFEILDRIEEVGEKLRAFLVDKFKLEDVL